MAKIIILEVDMSKTIRMFAMFIKKVKLELIHLTWNHSIWI